MKFAFYRGRKGGLLSRLIGFFIRRRTNGDFSHVEAVFPDGVDDGGKSWCWSSSEMDDGTRFKRIGILHDADWVIVSAPNLNAEKARAFCQANDGRPYDWRAIVRFLFGWKMPSNGVYFCSEAMVALAQDQGLCEGIDASTISPQDFYYLAKGGLR